MVTIVEMDGIVVDRTIEGYVVKGIREKRVVDFLIDSLRGVWVDGE